MRQYHLSGLLIVLLAILGYNLFGGRAPLPGAAAVQGEHSIFLPSLQLHQPWANILLMSFAEGPQSTSFRDDSPYRHHGACQDETCPASGVAGRLGNAVKVDGLDDSIRIEHTPNQILAAGEDLSVEALVLLESNSCGYCRILTKFDGTRGFNFDAGSGNGRNPLTFYINDGVHNSLARSTQELSLNEWHHLAAVFSRREGQVRLYIDGIETKYETRGDPSRVGEVSVPAPLVIGHLPGEDDSFQGLVKRVGVYKKALSANEIQTLAASQLPNKTAGYSRWNSWQAGRVLAAFALPVEGITPLTRADMPANPILFNEAMHFNIPILCSGCGGTIYSFANPQDLEATLSYLRSLGYPASHLIQRDNLLLQLNSGLSDGQVALFQTALYEGALEAMIMRVQDEAQVEYEPWSQYYATDRGQQRNSETRKSQRTFDRWEAEGNRWIFGQSTWLYQDPEGGHAPPGGMPATYAGRELDYYYHYHCEKDPAANPSQDCLNWQIYIELLTQGENDTEIANWARGGWKRHSVSPVEWEVFYKADAFNGHCDKDYIQANYNDAYLLDPAHKVPLLLRLPSVPVIEDKSQKFCTVIFGGYQQKAPDITGANFWYTTSQMLSKQYDPDTDRYVIQARNLYYEYYAQQGKEAVFKLFGDEVYTMRQVKPEEPDLYGLEAFWWGAWGGTPELDADRDVDPSWSELQWCHVDYSQGPVGLGKLICDEMEE
jgi:hypothetical protein